MTAAAPACLWHITVQHSQRLEAAQAVYKHCKATDIRALCWLFLLPGALTVSLFNKSNFFNVT